MNLVKKTTILILLITIGISTKMIIDKQINTDNTQQVSGQSSNWLYKRGIEIESHSPRTLFEEDILIIIDTKDLIASGKLQPNCNDIRFLDENNETPLKYWLEDIKDVENGCNTNETKIRLKIPSLKPEGKTIYFLYGNSTAPNFESDWIVEF